MRKTMEWRNGGKDKAMVWAALHHLCNVLLGLYLTCQLSTVCFYLASVPLAYLHNPPALHYPESFGFVYCNLNILEMLCYHLKVHVNMVSVEHTHAHMYPTTNWISHKTYSLINCGKRIISQKKHS